MNPVLCLICSNPDIHLNPDGRMAEHDVERVVGRECGSVMTDYRPCPGSSTQHYVAEGDEWKLVFSNGKEGRGIWCTHEVLKGPWNAATTFRNLRSNDLCALRDGKLVRVGEQRTGGIPIDEVCGVPMGTFAAFIKSDHPEYVMHDPAPVQSPAAPTDGEMLDWIERNKDRIFAIWCDHTDTTEDIDPWSVTGNPTDVYSGGEPLGSGKTLRSAIASAIQQEQQAK